MAPSPAEVGWDDRSLFREGLIEAADGKIGSAVDQVLLYCFHYDPVKGKYGVAIMSIIRILGTVTVLGIATAILMMMRRDRAVRTA